MGKVKVFEFSVENKALVSEILAKYPADRQRSAVLPLLWLAQDQSGGWLPQAAIEHVAELLAMPAIRVYEVASFYSMFQLKPIGRHLVQVCTTTPCWLRGSAPLVEACKKNLGIEVGETTSDTAFTLVEVECLGACVNAPVVQINADYYEDLDENSLCKILEELKAGKQPSIGSQIGRQCSKACAQEK